MAGQYQFTATCKNLLQEDVTFQSNIIPIQYAMPTPVPTEAPIVTPPQPEYVETPTTDGLPEYVDSIQQALDVVWTVCAVLAVISAGLLCAGLIRRMQQRPSPPRHTITWSGATTVTIRLRRPRRKSQGQGCQARKACPGQPAG